MRTHPLLLCESWNVYSHSLICSSLICYIDLIIMFVVLLERFGDVTPVEFLRTEVAIVTTGHFKSPTVKIKGNYIVGFAP